MKFGISHTLLYFALACFFQSNAQNVFYKMPDGKIHNEIIFKKIQEGVIKNGNLKLEIFDLYTNKDSVVKNVQLSLINGGNVVGFDPYAHHKKRIGSTFKIEAFKNDKNINYESNYLQEKPSLINFWFTRCPPCVAEIPNLNNVQSKFKDKVNFIAITFDTKEKVDAFLKKQPSILNILSMQKSN